MSTLGNTPHALTILRLEARKSYALGVHLFDPRGRILDISGCTLTIVAKPSPVDASSDATNILAADAIANIPVPTGGYAIFNLQAETLDVTPGEYEFAIVLLTSDGYSSVIVKGLLDVQQNTEWASVGTSYDGVNPPTTLNVRLLEQGVVNVYVGGQLPPGMNYVRDDTMAVLEAFDPDSIATVPAGGNAGEVYTKVGSADYDAQWRPIGNGQFLLDATGQPYNYVPAALGDGTWSWRTVGIDATNVPEGYAPVAVGDDTWVWSEVTVAQSDWNAGAGQPGEILNKPPLGSAAASQTTDFYGSDTIVTDMQGIVFQTTVPVSGTPGYLYLVYTP